MVRLYSEISFVVKQLILTSASLPILSFHTGLYYNDVAKKLKLDTCCWETYYVPLTDSTELLVVHLYVVFIKFFYFYG